MRQWMIAALAGAAGLALAGGHASHAADMPPFGGPSVIERLPIVQEFVSGWYLRGDIGYRTGDIDGVSSNFALPINNEMHDVVTGGLGAGYKAQWFRADVTIDYGGKARYSGDGAFPGAFSGKVETLTALANVYLDLGTWAGFTPYVGAGVGIVNFRTFDYLPPVGIVTVDSPSKIEMAWAYTAGLSYAVAPRWLIDMAYRRLHYGDVTFNPNLPNALTLTGLSAHEFRLGVRYTLD